MEVPLLNFYMNEDQFSRNIFENECKLFRECISEIDYSWSQFTTDFFGIGRATGTVKFYKNGLLDPAIYSAGIQFENSVDVYFDYDRVAQLVEEGVSIVAIRFDQNSIYVNRLCESISRFSCNMAVGNAYVSIRGDGTFGKHWDTHCVMAAQLIGKKRWKVYKPTIELPVEFQTSAEAKKSFDAELVLDEVLTAGDILYVPRGWWHETFSVEDIPSLHIAIGIYTVKAYDYLRWLINGILPLKLDLRRSLGRFDDYRKSLIDVLELVKTEALLEDNYREFDKLRSRLVRLKKPLDFEKFFESKN